MFEPVFIGEHIERVGKRISGQHMMNHDDPRSQHTHPLVGKPAGDVLAEHRQSFLELFVTGYAHIKKPEWLCFAIIISSYVRSYFVLKQGESACLRYTVAATDIERAAR